MSPRVSTEAKLALLDVIKQNKDILFGRFSSDIDNMHKQEKWEEVLVKSKGLGICGENRDRNFVRDKIYGTWKARTMERLDRAKKSGHPLDRIDLLILEIIGKERPPTIEGFQTEEESNFPGPAAQQDDDDVGDAEDDYYEGDADEPDYEDEDTATPAPTKLLEKKRKLELENQELQNYKTKLEILKLEMELGVPQSRFTQEFGVIVKTLRTAQKTTVRNGMQKGRKGN